MATDKEKIAALKAIRDKTLAEMAEMDVPSYLDDQLLEEDDSFPPHEDFGEEDTIVRYRPSEDEEDYYDEDTDDYDDAEDYNETDEYRDDDEFDDEIDEDDDDDDDDDDVEWHAVSKDKDDNDDYYYDEDDDYEDLPLLNIEFNGKNLENGEFDHENLQDANFSAANLTGVNFEGSDLRGADFSGANLTNTNLSGADLSGATFAGAQLIGTNFTGAKLKNVIFTDAFFQDAILLDIDIDTISLEELQQLIEYVAKYYPEKLNLNRINLTMLDLKKIDLTKVSLRGVDFTGCDFTGVNILELDLSECIITPEQIAQALGHPPTALELKRILAPKGKKAKGGLNIDFTDLFLNGGKQFGVINVAGYKGMDVDKLVKMGKKMYKAIEGKDKAPVQDKDTLEYIRQQNKANKEELRQVIEERKKRELANRRREKQGRRIQRENGGYGR